MWVESFGRKTNTLPVRPRWYPESHKGLSLDGWCSCTISTTLAMRPAQASACLQMIVCCTGQFAAPRMLQIFREISGRYAGGRIFGRYISMRQNAMCYLWQRGLNHRGSPTPLEDSSYSTSHTLALSEQMTSAGDLTLTRWSPSPSTLWTCSANLSDCSRNTKGVAYKTLLRPLLFWKHIPQQSHFVIDTFHKWQRSSPARGYGKTTESVLSAVTSTSFNVTLMRNLDISNIFCT